VAASAVDTGGWINDLTDSLITKVNLLPPLPDGGPFWPQSWSPDGQRLAGPKWIVPGIYVYSVANQTYRKISDDGFRAAWMDDRRLVLFANGNAAAIVDTVTGERRELGNIGASPFASTCTGVHCVLVSNQTDGDIWMATLGGGE
jgi:hypothetical protein